MRVTVGPFLDKTDGVTPETAITVTSCKLTSTVDDANVPTLVLDTAPTASGGSNDMVHITGDDAGFYDLELAAANVNYLGRMMLAITDAATHCPVFHEFMILPAMVYDSMILGTDDLDTNCKKWNDLTTVALPLVPTTAGRTLDVTATGEAGIDWANVGAPTTALDLSGTTIKTTQKVDVDTIKTNPVVNGGTITFPTNKTLADTTSAVGSVTGNVGGNVTGSVGSVVGAVGSVTGNVGGNVVGSVASVTAGVTVASGGIGSGAHAAAEMNALADAFLDRNMATGTDSGADNTTTRTVRQALRRLRNKEAIGAGTGTVYKENDSTASWTYAATTTAGNPLSAVDPT